ncbi:MAG: very short patch repair endonuclease [Candidatus Bathyarchaeum sp.]|nr:MAG: very short patch repair endonuclease [Candidatus Bathyarchaeum sp.]
MPDVFTKAKRSQVMSKIKSRGSKIEVKMKEALDNNGIDYEYQPKLFGKPDFLIKPNIALFCDSSFWHGRNWNKLVIQLKEGYWQDHIRKNKERDVTVTKRLTKQGYTVLRFWDDEITKDIESCIKTIKKNLSTLETP